MNEPVDLLPVQRKRRWFLPLVTVAAIGGASGAGYHAWQLREAQADSRTRIESLEAANRSLSDALDLHRASKVDLDTQLVTCKEDLEEERLGRVDTGGKLDVAEAELTACQASVSDLKGQKAEARALIDEFNALTRRFQRMIDTGKLEVEFRRGQMVVKLPAQVLFPSGSDELSEGGKAALAEVAGILRTLPGRRFTVAGHTDDVPVKGGAFASNWALSTARAVTVTQTLIRKGVKPRNLVAAGYGEFAPVSSNKTEAGRRRNRRIEIILQPDLRKLPLQKLRARSKQPSRTRPR